MKKLLSLHLVRLVLVVCPLAVACGSDSDDSSGDHPSAKAAPTCEELEAQLETCSDTTLNTRTGLKTACPLYGDDCRTCLGEHMCTRKDCNATCDTSFN